MIALTALLLALSGPVVPVGTFDNYRFSEEHQYGYGLRLWRQGEALRGTFSAADGLAGDTPTGLIRDGHSTAEGGVSFTATLMAGTHSCKLHNGVPERRAYTFHGRLVGIQITGTLEDAGLLHPEIAPRRTPVTLELRSRETLALAVYDTEEEWEAAVRKTWGIVEGNGGRP